MKSILPLIILGVLIFSGCQKKDSGPGPVDPGVTLNGCASCANIAAAPNLLTRVQSETPDGAVLFDLDIRGVPASPCYQPSNKFIYCAAGPATMVGYMRLRAAGAFCGLPAGDYVLRPLSVSEISNAMLYGGTFEAVGPGNVRVLMQLQRGILTNGGGLDLNSSANRIGLNMSIDSTGSNYGYVGTCGSLSTY